MDEILNCDATSLLKRSLYCGRLEASPELKSFSQESRDSWLSICFSHSSQSRLEWLKVCLQVYHSCSQLEEKFLFFPLFKNSRAFPTLLLFSSLRRENSDISEIYSSDKSSSSSLKSSLTVRNQSPRTGLVLCALKTL